MKLFCLQPVDRKSVTKPVRHSSKQRTHRKGSRIRGKRRLLIEPLEGRKLMAAYINEIHVADDNIVGPSTTQYIELRGDAGAKLPLGTYFVGVSSADGVTESGDINCIFNLSNVTFGSNGLIVILEAGNGYTVSPEATVLQGTSGFAGGSGYSFFSDSSGVDLHTDSNSYFLIQTSSVPSLTVDIDGDDNGRPDGEFFNWTVLDSVSLINWVDQTFPLHAYAQIAFRESGVGTIVPGSTSVVTDPISYVSRIGNSTGFAASDWMSGNTREVNPSGGHTYNYQLQHGVFGTPRPFAYGGRFLDNIGLPNWYGSISGSLFRDDNGDGTQQNNEPALVNVPVYADMNNSGSSGTFSETIEADNYADNTSLSNISSNVTLISAGSDNIAQGFEILAVPKSLATPNVKIMSHAGVGFFNNNRRIRMDFYRPVQSVSVDVIGASNLTATYGRLEIFDAANNSLGMIRTNALSADVLQRLTLSTNGDQIAWALAYSDDQYLSSSPFGMLDNISFVLSEKATVTDGQGNFRLSNLTKGVYPIRVDALNGFALTMPSSPATNNRTINAYQNFAGVNFAAQGVVAPKLDDVTFTISEDTPIDTVIAALDITRGYAGQPLSTSITSGNTNGVFFIEPTTGALKVKTTGLDFESQVDYTLDVLVQDTGNTSLSDTAKITIHLTDANDAPVVTGATKTIDENSPVGLDVATLSYTDQDSGLAAQVTWSIVAGNIGNAFAIDSNSGKVTVVNSSPLDYETRTSYALRVRATDKGTPPMIGDAILTVTLRDINDPPVMDDQGFSISENNAANASVGKIFATDPDAGQSLTFQVTGGTGAGLFAVNSNTGNITVPTAGSLNFETSSVYTLNVEVSDSGTPKYTDSAVLTITIVDNNDPPKINSSSFAVLEDIAAGGTVGTISATDEDPGQTLKYNLVNGADSSLFNINQNTGALTLAPGSQLNYESRSTLNFSVSVVDNGNPTATTTKNITIAVQDVNEAPQFTGGSATVLENSAADTTVITLNALDPDNNETLVYSIESQTAPWFKIDASGKKLVVADGADINFEVQSSNTVVLSVTDHGGLQARATFIVTALNQNDAPKLVTPIADQRADAGVLFQFVIPSSSFADEDAGDTLRFAVTDVDGFPLPSWLSYNTSTRTLSGTASDQDVGTVSLRVQAIDSGNKAASDFFDITVTQSHPWHNTNKPLDVTGDNHVSAIDALYVINYINGFNNPNVTAGSPPTQGYLDTNKDNVISPIDALLIINFLNSGGSSEGEGESSGITSDNSDSTQLGVLQAAGGYLAAQEQQRREELIALLALDRTETK
ncbi:MAG: cadherin domain-containing protein [Pirellulales bacterium]